jgi:prephenate dehydratase
MTGKQALISVGAVGGLESFAGQAAETLRSLYPNLGEPSYFANGERLFAALADGTVDAIVGAAANVGGYTILDRMLGAPRSTLYVIAECQLPFGCALLGRRGSRLADIRMVQGGPASLAQARSYLSENLPAVEIATYAQPIAAAQMVAESDGTVAIVGTRVLAEKYELDVLAADIDKGAINGNWWALSSKQVFHSAPDRLFVTGRLRRGGELARALVALSGAGYALDTVSATASGRELLEFDYVLRLSGDGALADAQAAVASFPSLRLAGAIRTPRQLRIEATDGQA